MRTKKEAMRLMGIHPEILKKQQPGLFNCIDGALELYAKEMCIAFADYKKDYRWLKSISRWARMQDNCLTTEELFNQFLQSLNKEQ